MPLLKFWLCTNHFLPHINNTFEYKSITWTSEYLTLIINRNYLAFLIAIQVQSVCVAQYRMLLNWSLSSLIFVWYRQQHILNSFNLFTNQGFSRWNDMDSTLIIKCFSLNLVKNYNCKIKNVQKIKPILRLVEGIHIIPHTKTLDWY